MPTQINPDGSLMPCQRVMLSQEDLDHLEAHERAIHARTPADVYQEWLRLIATMEELVGTDHWLTMADQARLFAIIDRYDVPASTEDMARHIADIVRERALGKMRTVQLLSDKPGSHDVRTVGGCKGLSA